MILVPTRELALQTAQVCKELGKHTGVEVMVTTGGTSLKEDIMRLTQEIHVVVATPGRILDLSNKGVCILNNCRVLVMDEVCWPCLQHDLPQHARTAAAASADGPRSPQHGILAAAGGAAAMPTTAQQQMVLNAAGTVLGALLMPSRAVVCCS